LKSVQGPIASVSPSVDDFRFTPYSGHHRTGPFGPVRASFSRATRLTLAAQQAAVEVAQSNIAAQEAQIRVLEQEKAYQRVVAPFDGVITQRNIDNGSLV
jgi:hypothetical protein